MTLGHFKTPSTFIYHYLNIIHTWANQAKRKDQKLGSFLDVGSVELLKDTIKVQPRFVPFSTIYLLPIAALILLWVKRESTSQNKTSMFCNNYNVILSKTTLCIRATTYVDCFKVSVPKI